ncbi:holo-ACP synthase [Candidatus Profftia tarda]|uniref:Holo-[acyl-carrier-protein] synthase n=1 Tax=Candidatus Profftia tarda TaxID=1177216 RepID=A0A8E4H455_9ENTR|nr:holo-ACP synthase [Candidatus Profftia tarda]CAD6506966.1 Holo-[acyl-carrier-protein] synthase [Candidatus Profftia tarda]
MTILGLGIDIVEISRIKDMVLRRGDQIARRLLAPAELERYFANHDKVRYLAKRFAAKEALVKAFGTGIRNGLYFSQFELYSDKLGKPVLYLHDRAAVFAQKAGIISIHVSLADERRYACATVITEG